MALAILDGTQTATTLSTVLSSGQHITAHTVVSLGTQAITDMRSAVSGSVVSISSLPAISGTVTVGVLPSLTNNTDFVSVGEQIAEGINNYATIPVAVNWQDANQGIGNLQVTATCVTSTNRIGVVTIGGGTVTIGAGTAQIGSVTASISGTVPISIASVTVGNSVTIGSLPAISGTVTANISISSSAITSGVFSSLTSATLVPGNTARKMATVYNLGAGQLFVNAGATATTLGGGFMVALSSGDFYECDYTTTTLSAIFATAGTASWVSH
jgi:hypothetical protein